MRRRVRWAGGMLAALVMAGCAANQPGKGAAGDAAAEGGDVVQVVVQNEGSMRNFPRIFLVPTDGSGRIDLGIMSTTRTDTLTARAPRLKGRYMLLAEGGPNAGVSRSPVVILDGSGTVVWNMRNHMLHHEP
ncbi:MAG TPA: hypothetical protein VE871_17205 [Longimicrobium sp.]|nr:hypothetical protein [Longimicrobium sp.]